MPLFLCLPGRHLEVREGAGRRPAGCGVTFFRALRGGERGSLGGAREQGVGERCRWARMRMCGGGLRSFSLVRAGAWGRREVRGGAFPGGADVEDVAGRGCFFPAGSEGGDADGAGEDADVGWRFRCREPLFCVCRGGGRWEARQEVCGRLVWAPERRSWGKRVLDACVVG